MQVIDDGLVKRVLALADRAEANGEVPVGALVVDSAGLILGQGRNRVEALGSQAEHAEIRAIRAAAKKLGDWRFDGATLLVSVEPCLQCFGLAKLSRIGQIVYFISSPVYGFGQAISFDQAFWRDSISVRELGDRSVAERCRAQMQRFFRRAR